MNSIGFNPVYYRTKYPDLSIYDDCPSKNLRLFWHYCNYGSAEGRIPSVTFADFNATKYLSDYPDLGSGGITSSTALRHYLTYGATEGRKAYTTGSVLLPPN